MSKAKTIKVQLQSAATTASATGQRVETWSTYATVYGSVQSLRGQAYYAAQQTANETLMELYIWHRTDVAAGHRAIIEGVTYEIAAPPVNLNMMNQELLLRLRVVG